MTDVVGGAVSGRGEPIGRKLNRTLTPQRDDDDNFDFTRSHHIVLDA